MSGFIGLAGTDLRETDHAMLDQCLAPATSSCPDFTGAWKSDRVDLRFAWLKVNDDTAREELPYSLNGRWRMVGDVRLDRRDDLLAQLTKQFDHLDASFPDSYLVLYAYRLWGKACVNKIAGDYSFAIWDEQEQLLFCARDHFGVIPFYYVHHQNGLLFTNFYRSLKEVPGLMAELENDIIRDYLVVGINNSFDRTVYKNIHKLAPAHTLTFHRGQLRIERYWQAELPAQTLNFATEEEYVKRFADILERTVADRLRSPRVATQLSGGMDSSAITAFAAKALASRYPDGFLLQACTIGYQYLVSEREGYFAGLTSRKLGIPLNTYTAEDQLSKLSLRMSSWLPEPAGIPEASPERAMMDDVQATCQVMLTGFGGDPLFLPDLRWWGTRLKQGQVGRLLNDLVQYTRLHGHPPGMGVKHRLKRLLLKQQPVTELPGWIHPDVSPPVGGNHPAGIAGVSNVTMFSNPLWQQFFEMSHPGFNGSRMKVRFPFFCLELVEFLQQVPPHLLAKKYLLRSVAAPFLPAEVIARPKTPLYGAPHLHNLRSSGVLHELVEAVSKEHRFLDGKVQLPALLALLHAPQNIQVNDHRFILHLIHLLAWRGQQVGQGSVIL